jgi:predicted permease
MYFRGRQIALTARMDFRLAFRTLTRAPGFTAVAILTLALGIGLNTVVFTIYNAVALKPIAARAPGELVRIAGAQNGNRLEEFSHQQYQQIRDTAQSFSGVVAISAPQAIAAEREVLNIRLVSPDYFSVLGVPAAVGRTFVPDDEQTAVLSYDYWTRARDSDASVVSSIIRSTAGPLRIVGVAPAGFAGTGRPPRTPDLWLVLPRKAEAAPLLELLARRKPGVTVQQASAEVEVLARSWPLVNNQPAHLAAKAATFFQTDSAGEFETFTTVCKVLLAAVMLILLIGSINLVNLLYARNTARQGEFAVRLAIGARRSHIVRQLCTESLLIGLAGGAGGLLLSIWACESIRAAIARTVERVTAGVLGVHLDVSPDWRIFLYTVAVSAISAIAIGIMPSLRASRRDVMTALKTSGAGALGRRGRNVLIAAQVAACLVLLAGAGLLFRGVWRSTSVDPGFDIHHVAVLGGPVKTMSGLTDRIKAIPGITSVAWADRPPFLGHGSAGFENEAGKQIPCLFNMVTGEYFETLGIPLLTGRTFTQAESDTSAPVAIISDVAARAAWPGQDPIGRRIGGLRWVKQYTGHDSYTVIGVVKGVRSTYLSKPDEPFLYFPRPRTNTYGGMLLRLRTTPEAARCAIFAVLSDVGPDLPVRTYMVGLDGAPLEIQRLMAQAPAVAAGILGTMALLLASLGVFGLVSQLVVQRTRELAIRISLGAQRRDIVRTVLGQSLRPVIAGGVLGMAGAAGISVVLGSLVRVPDMPDLTYGAGAFDPALFTGTLAVLALVVLAASLAPLRRANKIAPADALRTE